MPGLDKSKAQRTARQLSSLRALQSSDNSSGNECLKLRLKKLSRQLLEVAEQRRRQKQASTRTSNDGDGHRILVNTVGKAKCDEIISVYQEIKELRHSSAVWTKFSKQQRDAEDRLPASESFPTPVGDIYFRTPLMDAMRVKDDNTCAIQDWDGLLEDAKKKLSAFRSFELEHVNDGEKLSFQCSMCPSSKSCK